MYAIRYAESINGGESFKSYTYVNDDGLKFMAGKYGQSVASDEDDNAYVVWVDNRDSGYYDIYFAKGVPNKIPSCTITSPTDGAEVSGKVTFKGTAADPDGNENIYQVRVSISPLDWWGQSPTGKADWEYTYDTRDLDNGEYTFNVTVSDKLDGAECSIKVIVANSLMEYLWFQILLVILVIVIPIAVIALILSRRKRKKEQMRSVAPKTYEPAQKSKGMDKI
jgi:hypothetical protein